MAIYLQPECSIQELIVLIAVDGRIVLNLERYCSSLAESLQATLYKTVRLCQKVVQVYLDFPCDTVKLLVNLFHPRIYVMVYGQ